MKSYKKEIREFNVVDKETCDWCGKEVETPDRFMTNDFKLEFITGSCYPEGGDSLIKRVDLCFVCREKLLELLKSSGIDVIEEEYDW
jgi:hypothetical protein